MQYVIYQLASWFTFILLFPLFFIYSALTGKYRHGLAERLGFYSFPGGRDGKQPRIWLHAASVGEVQVARALIDEIRRTMPDAALFLSTVTEQGNSVARRQIGPDVTCFYAPLDLAGVASRALRTMRPSVYVCLETELWPTMIRQAAHQGAAVLLLNGRMSERSYKRYRMVKKFMRDLLSRFAAISVIGPDDATRYIALGAQPAKVAVHGNAKYDLTASQPAPEVKDEYRRLLALAGSEQVLVAGSTHTGEEAMLVEVYRELGRTLPDLLLLIVPRHLQRLAEVEALLAENALPFERLSQVRQRRRSAGIILVDSVGELAGLYSVATFVFCGGSLVPKGGHNIMEAAVWGKPVFYGPSMKDFNDARELLESAQAGFTVDNPEQLTRGILHLAGRPDEYKEVCRRAREAAMAQQGSATRQVALLREIINRRTH